ncbi:hypothetical protein [Streptomyces scopuliridis]|uniref:hypothetical protein n=1 Tax=Streptomyces scopuliridis TaxID=452529 RepID=UPI0036746036
MRVEGWRRQPSPELVGQPARRDLLVRYAELAGERGQAAGEPGRVLGAYPPDLVGLPLKAVGDGNGDARFADPAQALDHMDPPGVVLVALVPYDSEQFVEQLVATPQRAPGRRAVRDRESDLVALPRREAGTGQAWPGSGAGGFTGAGADPVVP